MGWGYWSFGNILGEAIQVVIIVFIVWVIVRALFGGGSWRRWERRRGLWESKTALDLLKERYAKGEINKEEFDQKKKDLE